MSYYRLISLMPKTTSNLLLDVYTNAAVAYSLRKLRTAYTGNCIRVRRSSDNAEQDFGFVNNVLDTASLLTFVGGGDGFITTWYDQSGNGNDLTRTSAVNQPQIVSAGSLIIDNGTPAVRFDGTNDSLVTNNTFTQSQPITSFGLFKVATNKNYVPVYGFGYTGSISLVDVTQYNVNSLRIGATGGSGSNFEVNHILNKSINLNTYYIASALYNTPNFSFTLNNNISTGTSGVNTLSLSSNNFSIGNQFAYGYTDATVKEVIVYFGNQSANITNIEYNINTFYSVFSSAPTWNGTQTGLLNTYPGAAAAYSVRALNSAYTGPLIRVRRSSDNNEIDIFALQNGQLDTTFLLAFCGAGNGFVTTWYDQSGNSKNATQSTAASQPQIVVSGVVNNIGGLPMITTFDKQLVNTQANTSAQSTFSAFQNETTGNNTSYLLPFLTIRNDTYAGVIESGSSSSPHSNFGTPSYYGNGSLLTSTRGALATAFKTGNKSLASVIGGGTTTSDRTLQYQTAGFSGNFKLFEVITYNSNQSSNRLGIESNINTYYTIY